MSSKWIRTHTYTMTEEDKKGVLDRIRDSINESARKNQEEIAEMNEDTYHVDGEIVDGETSIVNGREERLEDDKTDVSDADLAQAYRDNEADQEDTMTEDTEAIDEREGDTTACCDDSDSTCCTDSGGALTDMTNEVDTDIMQTIKEYEEQQARELRDKNSSEITYIDLNDAAYEDPYLTDLSTLINRDMLARPYLDPQNDMECIENIVAYMGEAHVQTEENDQEAELRRGLTAFDRERDRIIVYGTDGPRVIQMDRVVDYYAPMDIRH